MLFEYEQYMFANPAYDISPTITQKLDAAIPQWRSFELLPPPPVSQ